jgi:hypothetical protein
MTTDIVVQNSSPIKPQLVDGIELYATDFEYGMNQRELARFCGVDEIQIRRLLDSIVQQNSPSESLNYLTGEDLYFDIFGEKGDKIIRSTACAAICEYYAFESENANETAKFSYRKFAKLGIDSWIRDVADHFQKPALNPYEIALQMSMELIKVQRQLNMAQARLLAAQEDKLLPDVIVPRN